ncbi:hypothetical protein PENSPDRAFT_646530 [Peniophora sp. CONT]|nr:hypothetical protein PENSPDRAFT_646530 [Peniophora sp. CONT]
MSKPQHGFQQPTSYAGYPPQPPVSALPHETRALLRDYPALAITPTDHVARSMSQMSMSARPPVYANSGYYIPSAHGSYAGEMAHLASAQVPAHDGGYWERARQEAIHAVGPAPSADQYSPSYSYWQARDHPPTPIYQASALSGAVYQHAMPGHAYPSPPPGMLPSSSSLAHALDPPIIVQRQPPPPPPRAIVHPPSPAKPQSSAAFFNAFVQEQQRAMQPPPLPQSRPQIIPQPPQHLQPQQNKFNTAPTPATPRKRERAPIPSFLTNGAVPEPSPVPPLTHTPKRKRDTIEDPNGPQPQSPAKRFHSLRGVPGNAPSYAPPPPMAAPLLQHDLEPVTPAMSTFDTPHTEPPATPSTASTAPITPYTNVEVKKVKKRRSEVFVELPPRGTRPVSPQTPRRVRDVKMNGEDTDVDMSDEEDEKEGYLPSITRLPDPDAQRNTKRTGERDERDSFAKLRELIDDLFEADDSPDSEDSKAFFSLNSPDPTRLCLSAHMLRKLRTRILDAVKSPNAKRTRTATGQTPRTPKSARLSLADLDPADLGRLIRLLERSVRAGEDVTPFPSLPSSSISAIKTEANGEAGPSTPAKTPGKTPGKRKKEPRSATPASVARGASEPPASEADISKASSSIERARDAILAADTILALLSAERLPREAYGEEILTAILAALGNGLKSVVYPVLEHQSSSSGVLGLFASNGKGVAGGKGVVEGKGILRELFEEAESAVLRAARLVAGEKVALSEGLLLQASSVAIGPFFVVEPSSSATGVLGAKPGERLRYAGLALIRTIFSAREDQRAGILEDVLGSLVRLSAGSAKPAMFKLRNGTSIRTVSALLLQLIQSSAHDVRAKAKQFEKERQRESALRRAKSMNEEEVREGGAFLGKREREEVKMYAGGLESATKIAKNIVLFLTTRSGKGKTTKSTNEAEYRVIFEHLLTDVQSVLFWPEWPAAATFLGIVTKFFVNALDPPPTGKTARKGANEKKGVDEDNSALKSIALDHLGVVAARLRKCAKGEGLMPMEEIYASRDVPALERLVAAHRDVGAFLRRKATEDASFETARELSATTLAQELALRLHECDVALSKLDDGEEDAPLLALAQALRAALAEVWKVDPSDVFTADSQEEQARVDGLAEELGAMQDLRKSNDHIMRVVLLALDATAVFMRTKALKALGQVVQADPSVLEAENVKQGIDHHLNDVSPQTRDAAVDLVGKYVLDSPSVLKDYFPLLIRRIIDMSPGVRKRSIKLFKSIYTATDVHAQRVDISRALVQRLADEDDQVKDLALKTLEELWFPPTPALKPRSNSSDNGAAAAKEALQSRVLVLMDLAEKYGPAVEELLHRLGDTDGQLKRYGELVDALMEALIDNAPPAGFTVVKCIRTIHHLVSACPALLTPTHASTLLPYLNNASSAEDREIALCVLKIYRAAVPHMPHTAKEFGAKLQKISQQLMLKPIVGGGTAMMQETIACFCAVIKHLTDDIESLSKLVAGCFRKLQDLAKLELQQIAANKKADMRSREALQGIVALLCEHYDCDVVRKEHPDRVEENFKKIAPAPSSSITYTVYQYFLQLHTRFTDSRARANILKSLGYLFRAYPTLMTTQESFDIMDDVFLRGTEEDQRGLLRLIQEYFQSEAEKHTAAEKEKAKSEGKAAVDAGELSGNTDGYAESGVASTVVQRFLDPHILRAALSSNTATQALGVEILTFTVKQGLAHPIQCYPVLVALETSPAQNVAGRAASLHAYLHSKHASMLKDFTACARKSFEYQRSIEKVPRGYRGENPPTALLQRWYGLVREKRNTRLDFLRTLARALRVPDNLSMSADDVQFARYMAENFAAMEFKANEEVFTVIRCLTDTLSTAGMALVQRLQPAGLAAMLNDGEDVQMQDANGGEVESWRSLDSLPVMRGSVVVAIIMLLKAHLKSLYGLPEDKCLKYQPGKKSAVGDKAAVRRSGAPLSWDRLPFATAALETVDAMAQQRDAFLKIWEEDGLTQEPDEDMLDV